MGIIGTRQAATIACRSGWHRCASYVCYAGNGHDEAGGGKEHGLIYVLSRRVSLVENIIVSLSLSYIYIYTHTRWRRSHLI
jgi:hypothetical protein